MLQYYLVMSYVLSRASADIISDHLESTRSSLNPDGLNNIPLPHYHDAISAESNSHQTPSRATNRPTTRPTISRNYASSDCAKVIESNPEAKKSSNIINEMTDEYMLNPCKAKIWFVIELCENIQATQIEIANYELYSSNPKDLTVYFSDTYPAPDWKPIGHFTVADSRTLQAFDLERVGFGKYIRVELHSHYGSEHYCVISEVKVFGNSMVEEYLADQSDIKSNTTQKVTKLKRKCSAYKVYRDMMLERKISGLTPGIPPKSSSVQNVTSQQPFQMPKEPPIHKPLLPQPTQQPVVNNRTAPLKPSIFVELGNKVKTLEASFKGQIEDIERRMNEKIELVRTTEAKVDKLKLQFESFALIVLAYYVYKLMLDLM